MVKEYIVWKPAYTKEYLRHNIMWHLPIRILYAQYSERFGLRPTVGVGRIWYDETDQTKKLSKQNIQYLLILTMQSLML